MYTTRPLSLYKNSPEAITIPPEGPNSGYLVLQDKDSTPTYWFGLVDDPSIKDLPFPQNKRLSVRNSSGVGSNRSTSHDDVYLIPVINQPLSSNTYYAIKADGRRKGNAYASSKEEDMVTCCFCIPSIQDEKPRPFDPDDIYQQFVFSKTQTFFNSNMMLAKSIAYDGHPPEFLRREGWTIDGKPLKNSMLREARGLDSSLRAHLPDFDFPASQECSNSVVVGKWCCPFIFIKEGTQIDQIKYSVFYEMTLEQRWERIFTADRNNTQENAVTVDVVVPTEMVSIAGQEATQEEGINDNGVVWFYGRGAAEHVGVSSLIIERMMWEEGRVGWFKNKEKQVRVTKNEEYTGVGDWISFSCYLLVETFVLRRNDGTILLTYDFRHTHHIRSKWE